MKKSKPKFIKKKNSHVKEPLVAYETELPLTIFARMSMQDIAGSELSGMALQDMQKQTSLSPQALASVVGVSKSKYYDLIKLDKLGSKNIDALADFAMLWRKGIEAFDGDKDSLNEWLEIRNENLGQIKPIDLISSRMGRRELEKAFLRIEYSTYG
ncbi:MAG: DUF2384 domain-containing protein [Cytophagales bacterium]|nr:DUF2384 domain-containing protein [Cytophagales bacterium]